MTNELSVQETFKQRISGNLQNQFMELMPTELLDELTDAAWDEFINGSPQKRHNRDYNPFQDPDTVKGMIMVEMREQTKQKIKEVFTRPEWQSRWDCNSNSYVTEAIDEIVANNVDMFVQAMFKQVVSSFMQNSIANFRNYT